MKKTISKVLRESLKVLILVIVLCTFGGFGLESVSEKLYTIIPLLILFPALNNMIGSFGTIISSKFTTLLYLGKISKNWRKSKEMRRLIRKIFIIALIMAVYLGIASSIISLVKGYNLTSHIFTRVLLISIITTFVLISIITIMSIMVGIYVYKKDEDPDNFLIPITTAFADLGSMLVLSLLIVFI